MDFKIIIITIAVFLVVVLILVAILLFARAKLMPSGKLKITINGEKELIVEGGSTLLSTLSAEVSFYHLLAAEAEHVFNVLVKFIQVEVVFYQQKRLIFLEKKLLTTLD